MKKSELKEMIKAAFMAENQEEQGADEILASLMGTDKDPYMAEEKDMDEMVADLYEAEDEEEVATDIDVDAEEGGDEEVDVDVDVDAEEEAPAKNDSIVIDKKIVSLSSLPGETRKILDTLETLRAQAEEFGDQKFITQVGNTITFFTRDFVVAGDAPNPQGIEEDQLEDEAKMGLEEVNRWKKLAGIKIHEAELTQEPNLKDPIAKQISTDLDDKVNIMKGVDTSKELTNVMKAILDKVPSEFLSSPQAKISFRDLYKIFVTDAGKNTPENELN